MTTPRSSATDPGTRLVAALVDRDFWHLARVLTDGVCMRALIPPGLVEVSGAEAAAAKFSSWFGDAEELDLMRSGSDTVADRLHVFYQLRVKKPGDVSKIVEQHLLCKYDDDRIMALDLVCSGFRPDETEAPQQGSRTGAAHSAPEVIQGAPGRPKRDEAGQIASA